MFAIALVAKVEIVFENPSKRRIKLAENADSRMIKSKTKMNCSNFLCWFQMLLFCVQEGDYGKKTEINVTSNISCFHEHCKFERQISDEDFSKKGCHSENANVSPEYMNIVWRGHLRLMRLNRCTHLSLFWSVRGVSQCKCQVGASKYGIMVDSFSGSSK